MSIETKSTDGRYVIRFRRERSGPGRLLDAIAVVVGLTLSAATVVATLRVHGAAPVPLALSGLLSVATVILAATALGWDRVRCVLDVASGELEVDGRGYGAVEVDRVVLARRLEGEAHLFSVLLVPRHGPVVALVRDEPDEPAALDAAMVVAQGVGVELDDRRYPAAPAAGPEVPPDLALVGDERREVMTWSCAGRFRPRAALLLLGCLGALSWLLAEVPGLGVTGILIATALVVAFALGLCGHVTGSLAIRRVTLRPDGVRVERRIGPLVLTRRLIPHDRLKAVLLHRKGPAAILRFRVAVPHPGAMLPLEDPAIAEFVKRKVERAAHDAGRRQWEATLR